MMPHWFEAQHRYRGHRRLCRTVACGAVAEWTGLFQRTAGAPGSELFRRLAHAPQPGARADAPRRPAAAGRADQPPRSRSHPVAGAVSRALSRQRAAGLPRPRIPECLRQPHRPCARPDHRSAIPATTTTSSAPAPNAPCSRIRPLRSSRRKSLTSRISSAASAPRPPRPSRRKAASRRWNGWSASPRRMSITAISSWKSKRRNAARTLLMRLEKASCGYGDKTLLENISLVLRSGARIALLGPQRRGQIHPDQAAGGRIAAHRGQAGNRAGPAHRLFCPAPAGTSRQRRHAAGTPGAHRAQEATTQELRNFLGRFGLAGEREDRPVASFSGGEKSRLALALLAWQKPHLLLLDEPTNHLDLDMRDALTLALEEYTGAMVLVSHDRSLIRATADELWLVADGGPSCSMAIWKIIGPGWKRAARPTMRLQQAAAGGKAQARECAAQESAAVQAGQTGSRVASGPGRSGRNQPPACRSRLVSKRRSGAGPGLNQQRETLEARVAQLEEDWLELEMALEEAL